MSIPLTGTQIAYNDGLQLRRAISIQAGGKRLLEKHAIAPSAARLCFMKGCQEKKQSYLLADLSLAPAHNRTRKPFNSRRQGSFLPSSPQQLLEIFLSDRGLASSWECRPLFYLRLRLNSRVFAYCYLRSCRGAYSSIWSLGAARVRLATHVTQSLLILPPNLFFQSLPAGMWFFLAPPAGL